MRIDFDQTAYEVVEDAGSVEVCATLSGPDIERNLMVLLIISEDTAQSKYNLSTNSNSLITHILSCSATADDFESGDRVLSFSPNASTSCVSIGILSDNLVEGDEVFSVSLQLQANQTFAELGSSVATVTIIDSDGGINFRVMS